MFPLACFVLITRFPDQLTLSVISILGSGQSIWSTCFINSVRFPLTLSSSRLRSNVRVRHQENFKPYIFNEADEEGSNGSNVGFEGIQLQGFLWIN
jgi:hypothetical protein